ncbi:hypothetical protein PIB30_105414 [Stylosanthes scabra]|uniref:Uncharacterized protein n=1 Tax=Stylosanthes scabra TaxID=79078 RepID=A0ABU6ZX32_9FABA|nr:hypothetical protein [Stylosanthes scabra]
MVEERERWWFSVGVEEEELRRLMMEGGGGSGWFGKGSGGWRWFRRRTKMVVMVVRWMLRWMMVSPGVEEEEEGSRFGGSPAVMSERGRRSSDGGYSLVSERRRRSSDGGYGGPVAEDGGSVKDGDVERERKLVGDSESFEGGSEDEDDELMKMVVRLKPAGGVEVVVAMEVRLMLRRWWMVTG